MLWDEVFNLGLLWSWRLCLSTVTVIVIPFLALVDLNIHGIELVTRLRGHSSELLAIFLIRVEFTILYGICPYCWETTTLFKTIRELAVHFSLFAV